MDSSLLPLLPYIIPSVVTIILTTGIVFYAQRYYNSPMARGVSYMCVAAGVWSFARLCGLLSIDPATNLWWGRFEYFGIVSVPVAWLYFALHYTGNSSRKGDCPCLFQVNILPNQTMLAICPNEHQRYTRNNPT